GPQIVHDPCRRNHILWLDAELVANNVAKLLVHASATFDSSLFSQCLDYVLVEVSNAHESGCIRVGNINGKMLFYPNDEFNGVEAHLGCISLSLSERDPCEPSRRQIAGPSTLIDTGSSVLFGQFGEMQG